MIAAQAYLFSDTFTSGFSATRGKSASPRLHAIRNELQWRLVTDRAWLFGGMNAGSWLPNSETIRTSLPERSLHFGGAHGFHAALAAEKQSPGTNADSVCSRFEREPQIGLVA